MFKVTNSELRILICDNRKEFMVDERYEPRNETITVRVGPCSTSRTKKPYGIAVHKKAD
jgi:hypothetical protein